MRRDKALNDFFHGESKYIPSCNDIGIWMVFRDQIPQVKSRKNVLICYKLESRENIILQICASIAAKSDSIVSKLSPKQNTDEWAKALGILFYKPNKLRTKVKAQKKSPHSLPVQPVFSNTSPQLSTSTFFLGGNASATLGLPARLCGHRLLGSTYTYLSLTPSQTTYLDFGHLLWAWNSH
jgi:hypothetical protein